MTIKAKQTWNFHMLSSKISIWLKKTSIKKISRHQIFFIENIIKVTLQYLYNVFVLINTFSYLKLNFKLKIDPKMCTFKNLEKSSGNHHHLIYWNNLHFIKELIAAGRSVKSHFSYRSTTICYFKFGSLFFRAMLKITG